MESTTNNGIISFAGSDTGQWRILSMNTVAGSPLELASHLEVIQGEADWGALENPKWALRAFVSNLRYTSRAEKNVLDRESRGLASPEFNHAALIPIKKSTAWWQLAQDERRQIFEEDSRHIASSLQYLPFISRQLHHSRDLGEAFDFLTWFEFSSEHDQKFDALCQTLRQTAEWKYVEREVDIRLERVGAGF